MGNRNLSVGLFVIAAISIDLHKAPAGSSSEAVDSVVHSVA